MSEPVRWQQDPTLPRELREALDDAVRLKPLGPAGRARLWRGLERRSASASGPSPWRLVPAAAGIALAAVATAFVFRVTHPPPILAESPAPRAAEVAQGPDLLDLGRIGQLEVAPGTVLALPVNATASGYAVSLTSGRVCAHIAHRDVAREGPFVVEAPQLRVVVVGTRFCVDAAADRTTVSVSEGTVRVVRSGLADVPVTAGGIFRSDAPSPPAPAPVARPPSRPRPVEVGVERPPAAGCASLSALAARADCYARSSGGDDLAAQNALFALALLQRSELRDGPAAVGSLHAYLARFPDGALAPEAHQTLVYELAAEGRRLEALQEANRYLAAYGQAGRAAEIARLRVQLLREQMPAPIP